MSGDAVKEGLHSGRSSSSSRAHGKSFSNFDISGGRNHIGDYYGSGSDSHERDCAQGTRLSVIKEIETWASGQHNCRIFWLYGLAGTGKSTIARTIARRLDDTGRLGATFFFSKGGGDSGSAAKLVGTVAVQLAQRCEELREHIELVVRRNERIASAALLDQWKKLVVQPLLMLDDRYTRPPIVLIIDALDECDTERSIIVILHMLALALPGEPLPIRILLTSRPEGSIRNTFAEMPPELQETFALHHIAPEEVNQDIAMFLAAELAHIGLRRGLAMNWIGDGAIARLTESSGGLFIWAATACRYISDGRRFAEKRFHQLLDQSQRSEDGPEAKLDSIYLMVLDNSVSPTYTAQEREDAIDVLRLVLGSLIVLYSSISALALSKILGLPLQDIGQTLEDLHAILDVPKETTLPLRLHHPSLRDFLLSQDRCTNVDFCIDGAKAHRDLATACLRIMSDSLRMDICQKNDPAISIHDVSAHELDKHIPAELRYACLYWTQHITSAGFVEDFDVLYLFLTRHLLNWLETMSWMGRLQEGIVSLRFLPSCSSEVKRYPELYSFLDDAYRFVVNARVAIETYPLQTYVSAILFAPTGSVIRKTFQAHVTPQWIASGPQMPGGWSSLLHPLQSEASKSTVVCFAFSPDDRWLATGWSDGRLEIWSVVTGTLLHSQMEHTSDVYEVRFSSTGMQLASACRDSSLKTWETLSGRCIQTLSIVLPPPYPFRQYQALYFVSGDERLVHVESRGIIQLWDLESAACLYEGEGCAGDIVCTALSPKGERLALGYLNGEVWLWHSRITSTTLLLSARYAVRGIAFTSETHLTVLAVGNNRGVVQTWDCTTATVLKAFSLPLDRYHSAVISPSGMLVAWNGPSWDSESSNSSTFGINVMSLSATDQRQVFFEEAIPAGSVAQQTSTVRVASFSPLEDVLATINRHDCTVTLYDVSTGLHIKSIDETPSFGLAFSESGRILGTRGMSKVQLYIVEGSVQEVRRQSSDVSIAVHTNCRKFGLQSPLSGDLRKQRRLTLTPTPDEWIVAFSKRIVWVPYQFRHHNRPTMPPFSHNTAGLWADDSDESHEARD